MLLSKAYIGSTEVQRIYLGSTLVYENNPVDPDAYNYKVAVNLSTESSTNDIVPGNWNNLKPASPANGTVFSNLVDTKGNTTPVEMAIITAAWVGQDVVPYANAPVFPAKEAYTVGWGTVFTATLGLQFRGLTYGKRYSVQVLTHNPDVTPGTTQTFAIAHPGQSAVATNQVAMVRDATLPSPDSYDEFNGWMSFDNLTPLQADGTLRINFGKTPSTVTSCRIQSIILTEYEVESQHTAVQGTTTAPLPHYYHTPPDYESTADNYPVIIFLHGNGEAGNGTSQLVSVTKFGIPRMLEYGSFNRDEFLVFSPQRPASGGWINYLTQLGDFINYIKSNYRVDASRVYMVGFSGGGYGILDYISANPGTHGIAAAVLAASRNLDGADLNIVKDVPMWLFGKTSDSVVPFADTIALRDGINSLSPPVPCKLTAWTGSTHDSINAACDGTGMDSYDTTYDAFDTTIYDWLLQYTIT